jgi:cysteinyl-tRNA synthetase
VLFELAKPLRALANRIERGDPAAEAEANQSELIARCHLLQELAGVLGLKIETEPAKPDARGNGHPGAGDAEIQVQIEERLAAKASKNFQEADRIRDALKAQGIELIDKGGGHTEWLRH